ncbi:methyltransferase type 12, partial [mine drainage metagenome]
MSYDGEADFYDYTWETLTRDISFYRRRLRGCGTVLDAMCGTGRVSLAMARAGFRVWGIDSSGRMLAKARERMNR